MGQQSLIGGDLQSLDFQSRTDIIQVDQIRVFGRILEELLSVLDKSVEGVTLAGVGLLIEGIEDAIQSTGLLGSFPLVFLKALTDLFVSCSLDHLFENVDEFGFEVTSSPS